MDTGRGWFGWVLPGSLALHVIFVAVLPGARRAPVAQPPVVIEMADPPALPEPPKPPPTPEPEPEPTPTAAPTINRANIAPSPARVATAPTTNESPSSNDRPADDSPVDFSSAVMSNDGPGVAIGNGGGSGGRAPGPRVAAPAAAAPGPTRPAEPRLVAARDLSRPPRAPGLDVALEKHYPADARQAGISGKAVLRVKILPDGRVGTVQRLEESRSGFGEACEKTVRSARWEAPIDREGNPVATEITYTCRFEIRG